MAKYKKRPDGRYATSTIVGYTDDGKPKRKTLYGRTIMELDKKVAEFKSLQNKGNDRRAVGNKVAKTVQISERV